MVERYREAEAAILDGQTVQWGDRRVGLPDLPEIRAGRQEWERRLEVERRGSRTGFKVAGFGDG